MRVFSILIFGLLSLLLSNCQSPYPSDRKEQANESDELRENASAPVTEKDVVDDMVQRQDSAYFRYYQTIQANPDANDTSSSPVEVNRSAPLFKEDCAQAAEPLYCSQRAVNAYIQKYLQYPDDVYEGGEEFTAVFMVEINKRGAIQDAPELVDMSGEYCGACVELSKKFIRDMPDWKPALQEGEPVASSITLPVRFQRPQ